MSLAADVIRKARGDLYTAKVMTGDQVMGLMECSLRTVQRRLRQWCCHTSFNHNGRYYALPQVVEFDEYGIWEYQSVCFSRFGNLSETVAGVIDEADQGLTAVGLARRLHVNVHGFLSQFAARQLFTREKLGGVFRYFSADPKRAAQQRESYLAASPPPQPIRLSDAAAVKLLLACINDPDAEATALSHTLEQQHIRATPEAVALFLDQHDLNTKKKNQITQEVLAANAPLCDTLRTAASQASGTARRQFMAALINALGTGAQRWAERTLGWNRLTIRRGQRERAGQHPASDHFHPRGRKPVEHHLPALRTDIKAIVQPHLQQDPTFRTTQLYRRVTAKMVRDSLLELDRYTDDILPSVRTICSRLNQLEFLPRKVAKSKPLKKIEQTDAIFERLHQINAEADRQPRVLRLSMDAKAAIKVGPFSRGGRNRRGEEACDHDFGPVCALQLFGIFLPQYDINFLFFNETKVTADLIVDCLELLWPRLQDEYGPLDTLVINLDNGPENHSRRTQFLMRMVELVHAVGVHVSLVYYPPYHSKYNAIERVWGVLENYWRGELLDSREKVLALGESMTWKGRHPEIMMLPGVYSKGMRLNKSEVAHYESLVHRLEGLEPWFVDIHP